ncbi:thioredoxin family protein [Niastella populi]|uniref:Thioredoxin domain-containing protein n=1 Tax=Niastella populi TaxID=550983 RepID=A0A1V9ENZ7_9BACT|nr:thioredoxin family protein [Niastella populi]OQP47883.1 hypothetical protein A4R26_31700 [Niastella populi]
MKTILYIVFFCITSVVEAQVQTQEENKTSVEGIEWTKGLNWKQIFNKAKKEKKYVFFDCHATWCGPCKGMERDVFTDKQVVEFYNKHFISVRLQMDRTQHDDSNTRKLYNVANMVNKKYGVPAYPTFLYFSSDGKIVYRDQGYKEAANFIHIGKISIQAGSTFPFPLYYTWLTEYQKGKKDYSVMAKLADTAKLLGQNEIARKVSKEYRSYLLNRKDEWLKSDNLSFMAHFISGSNDPFFKVFYENSDLIDSLLNENGLAQYVVDTIIQREEIEPLLGFNDGLRSSNEQIMAKDGPAWNDLKLRLSVKYNEDYVERNILLAKLRWYNGQHQWGESARVLTTLTKKYPRFYKKRASAGFINSSVWDAVFKRSVDKEQIDAAIDCMSDLVNQCPSWPDGLDTYANLLYKAGRVSEAILYEEKAIASDPKQEELRLTLQRMRDRRPTWPHYISTNFWDRGIVD